MLQFKKRNCCADFREQILRRRLGSVRIVPSARLSMSARPDAAPPVALSVWFFRVEREFCAVATISECDRDQIIGIARIRFLSLPGSKFKIPVLTLGGPWRELEFQKITCHDSRQLIFHSLCTYLDAFGCT